MPGRALFEEEEEASVAGAWRRRKSRRRQELRGRQQPGSPEAFGTGRMGFSSQCGGVTRLIYFSCPIKLSYFPWVCLI